MNKILPIYYPIFHVQCHILVYFINYQRSENQLAGTINIIAMKDKGKYLNKRIVNNTK